MRRFTTTKFVSFIGSRFDDRLDMDSAVIGSNLFIYRAYLQGVRLVGLKVGGQLAMDSSKFKGKLNMNSVYIGGSLIMRNARFKEVDLSVSKVIDQLEMTGSKFEGKLNMNVVSIGSRLIMKNAQFKEVGLAASKVGVQLEIDGSEFDGKLNMGSTTIGGNFFFRNARFKEVHLVASKVGIQLEMGDSKFNGNLNMNSVSIGGDLIMKNVQFREVDLKGLEIGDQLEVGRSKFEGPLNMDFASIGGNLFLRNATFHKQVRLMFILVRSNLDVRGSTLKELDLSGAQIGGEFWLGQWGPKKTKWKGSFPKLVLRNTSVGALQDTEDSWPDNLEREFEGFIYQRLGGFGVDEKETPFQRSSEWFINWLERDKSYSPQPYLQLASVLRAAGYEDKADDILYANRERQRNLPETSQGRWFLLSLLKETIGYGYGLGYFHALRWVLGLVLLGAFFLRINEEGHIRETQNGNKIERLGLWYSLDMLLPVIRLRQEHYEVDLETQ